jgi:protein gp37
MAHDPRPRLPRLPPPAPAAPLRPAEEGRAAGPVADGGVVRGVPGEGEEGHEKGRYRMNRTTISWTDRSCNPIRARHKVTGKVGWHCVKVSPGCARCYAATLNGRFGTKLPYARSSSDQVELFLDPKVLAGILRLCKPSRIFLCDMIDLFQEGISDDDILRIWCVIEEASHHTFQILTKRADRMAAWVGAHKQGMAWRRWPLPNVHLGVSVESQMYADERIPHLLRTPAAVRFLSVEPLLSAVDLTRLDNGGGETYDALTAEVTTDRGHRFIASDTSPIDWCIMGGESGIGARPCKLEWLRSLVRQCRSANVPAFLKQLGSNPHGEWGPGDPPTYTLTRQVGGVLKDTTELSRCKNGRWKLRDSKGGDIDEFPEDLKVRQFPREPEPSLSSKEG